MDKLIDLLETWASYGGCAALLRAEVLNWTSELTSPAPNVSHESSSEIELKLFKQIQSLRKALEKIDGAATELSSRNQSNELAPMMQSESNTMRQVEGQVRLFCYAFAAN